MVTSQKMTIIYIAVNSLVAVNRVVASCVVRFCIATFVYVCMINTQDHRARYNRFCVTSHYRFSDNMSVTFFVATKTRLTVRLMLTSLSASAMKKRGAKFKDNCIFANAERVLRLMP